MSVGSLALLGAEPRLQWDVIPRDLPSLSNAGADSVRRTLASGHWSLFTSNEVERFESEFAEYVGAKHAVLLNSCTTAIQASLRVHGVGSGDAVAVPAYTYIGSAMPILEVGADVRWLDVQSATPNASPNEVERAVGSGHLACLIYPLLFGSESSAVVSGEICRRAGVPIVFDCAQFLGCHEVTSKLCDLGVCCFSFGESKILRIGEGGAVATNSDSLAEQLRRYRHEGESWLRHGRSRVSLNETSPHDVLYGLGSSDYGSNLRPLAIAASLGRVQLRSVADFITHTAINAGILRETLGASTVVNMPANRPIWWTYPCTVNPPYDRDVVLAALLADGIPAGVHFPRLVPQHPVFSKKADGYGRTSFPGAEHFSSHHLVLPIYPAIPFECCRLMAAAIEDVLASDHLLGRPARDAAVKYLSTVRIDSLSSGLYMFLRSY